VPNRWGYVCPATGVQWTPKPWDVLWLPSQVEGPGDIADRARTKEPPGMTITVTGPLWRPDDRRRLPRADQCRAVGRAQGASGLEADSLTTR